jgi:20S proteasome alpha/beta subunit
MTTVVYRDGVLASDSRVMNAGWVNTAAVPKVWREEDGSLFAVTGDYAMAVKVMKSIIAGGDGDGLGESARVIRVASNGEVTVFEEGGSFPVSGADFYAWGSGFPVALGALHMGASAEEAVRIAALVDPNTGGAVVSVRHDK